MAAHLLSGLLVLTILPAMFTSAYGSPMLAVAWNETGKSTSTSNPHEKHIQKGVELAMKNESIIWVDHGESVQKTIKAIDTINRIDPAIVVGFGNSFQALLASDRLAPSTMLISPCCHGGCHLDKEGQHRTPK
ncbi:MAG: hypothetical protein HC902_13760 [Calothrix sp. SM1_5_4]|nr:hypothetical protein [Calothrix sp. SM1_5_4]